MNRQGRCSGRVAVVSTSYPSDRDDAAGHFVATEVQRIAPTCAEVTVLVPWAQRGHAVPPVHLVGIPHLGAFGSPGAVVRLRQRPDRWLGLLLFVLLARRALRRFGPFDRVLAHFLVPGFWPIACASSTPNIEVVVHGSDLRLLQRLPRFVRRLVLRDLSRRAGAIRCVSHELASRLSLLLCNEADQRIRVEPSPIDMPGCAPRSVVRERLGVHDQYLVVIVGRLVRNKRVDLALAAATALPATRVVVCGDGPERVRLQEQFPHVSWCGQVARAGALDWIRAADLLLCASESEGAPTVIREARMLGVPVVTTAVGDVARWAERDPELWVVT
jgi:glycosyltransferase involved in cell wall biosynthesis